MTPESILAAAIKDVAKAIEEDVGSGDVNAALINPDQESTASLISNERGIFCGQPWVNEVVNQIGDFVVDWLTADGWEIGRGTKLAVFNGQSRAILTAERTMLNFAQTLSGTATKTYQFANQISLNRTRILDTRKTVPGLRVAQKYAVKVGGGENHRMGLFDAFLIKENHIAAAGSIENAVNSARLQRPDLFLQVEVENLNQLETCVELKVSRVLIDNFTVPEVAEAVRRFGDKIELEASGNISFQKLSSYAAMGVHFISIGALTKHVRALDFSLRIEDSRKVVVE